LYKTVKRKD